MVISHAAALARSLLQRDEERKEKRAVGNPCDDAHLWGGIGQWTAGLVLFVDGE